MKTLKDQAEAPSGWEKPQEPGWALRGRTCGPSSVSLRDLCWGQSQGDARTRLRADRVGDLRLAVVMEVRMVEMKSGPLEPFGKNIGELGNCLDRGQVETEEMEMWFLTLGSQILEVWWLLGPHGEEW